MKVTVDARTLSAALSRATGAINKVKQNPILLCVRIFAGDGEMVVSATDMDRVITVRMACEGECEPVCIDFTRLASVVGTMKDRGDLTMDVGQDTAVITCGRSRFTLPFFKSDIWPNLDEVEWQHSFEVSGPQFARLMTALEPAISSEASRFFLNGIYLHPGAVSDARRKGCLLGVATDGHKMYARHIEVPELPPAMAGIIVPAIACAGIAKLFGEIDVLRLSVTERKLKVAVDGTDYITKLIEASYPDWRRVSPAQPSAFSYDTAQLTAALQVASAAKSAEKAGKAVKLSFGDGETTLEAVDSNNPAFTGSDAVPHSALDPPLAQVIGVNVDYLIEMLARLDAETVELAPPEGNGPIAVRGATFDDRIVAIMPMRV